MFNSFLEYLYTHTPLLYFTQSLWRDEAFSVLIAEPGGWETIKMTAVDYNPPLYYLILHFWMKIFGQSEISLRSLSFIFFIALLFVVYQFSRKVFKGKWPYIVTALAAVNPMLVYYGFEARMYSLYAFLTTASMYFFYTKKWKNYIFFTVCALYTQPFTVFVPMAQGVYLFLTKKLDKRMFLNLITPFLFYLPWIYVILQQFQRSGQMWIYPINLNLIGSVLGNLFIGYEGTPWFLWTYTKIFSLLMVIIFAAAMVKKDQRRKNLLFFLWLFVPLTLVLGISYFKPIFVNRYVITVSVAEIFLLVLGILTIPWKKIRILSTVFLLSLSVFFLIYLPAFIKKVNIRNTFALVNKLARSDDLILARSPLVFFESLYYSQDRSRVFLYNPNRVQLPGYLGITLIPISKQTDTFPTYPKRAFMIYENGDFELNSYLSK